MINKNEILYCLVALILGYLIAKVISGDGFTIGGSECITTQKSNCIFPFVQWDQESKSYKEYNKCFKVNDTYQCAIKLQSLYGFDNYPASVGTCNCENEECCLLVGKINEISTISHCLQ